MTIPQRLPVFDFLRDGIKPGMVVRMKMDSFLRIPREVMCRKDLTLPAKAVYAALNGYAWGDKLDAYPTVKRLANDIGESVDTVRRGIKVLEAHGLIEVTHRKNPDNPRMNDSNLYILKDLGTGNLQEGYSQDASMDTRNMQGRIVSSNRQRNTQRYATRSYSEFDDEDIQAH